MDDDEAAAGLEEEGVDELNGFDSYDVPVRCRELLRRCSLVQSSSETPPWKWDILEFLEESRQQLGDAREAHSDPHRGAWRDISEALGSEQTASTLPVGLRKQCEELLAKREIWLGDFDTELRAVLARGRDVRERLLFEDADRAGWFGTSGVSPVEVQRLLERHLDMHQRASRLARQLKLVRRALSQQGAVSRRLSFQAKTMGEKLQSSLVCLAAVAVAPIPGSGEMWLASTTMMLLDKDQAWQNVVYEHPRDADTENILNQFQCRSKKVRQELAAWLAMPTAARKGTVLVHNASVKRVSVKTHMVNCIDGFGNTGGDWTAALDNHPLGGMIKKGLSSMSSADAAQVVTIGAQRVAVVSLPRKPDMNWSWRGSFSNGDTKVGECRLREGGVFSFICVDCGLRVGDREGGDGEFSAGDASPTAAKPRNSPSSPVSPANDIKEEVEFSLDVADPAGEIDSAKVVEEVDPPLFGGGLRREDKDGEDNDTEKVAEEATGEEDKAKEPELPPTRVEVVNRTDLEYIVKIWPHSSGGHASKFFRAAEAEGSLVAGASRVFELKATNPDGETNFDVEIKVRGTMGRTTKCEVVGEQVIFIDGNLNEGP